MAYSRQSPSPRYTELLGYYAEMHDEGEVQRGKSAEKTFDGRSLAVHINGIRRVTKHFGAKTLLDYGSGKAKFYEDTVFQLPDRQVTGLKALWGLDEVRLFDPGYAPYAAIPEGRYDVVVCTDVLEHIPEEDLPWVIDELFSYANQVVYASVAIYAAAKILPNGENAHVTLRPVEWWTNLFEASRGKAGRDVQYALVIERRFSDPEPPIITSF